MSYADELYAAREQAKMYVCGNRLNKTTNKFEPVPGGWHEQFRAHPYVRIADDEGWGRELRSHLIFWKTRTIMAGRTVSVEELMPTKEWIDGHRARAARYTFGTLARPGRTLSDQSRRQTGEHV